MADVTIAVIGCGNPARTDDGVGPAVVNALAATALGTDRRVRLLDAGTDGMRVMFEARECGALVVVDACRSGSAPGTVFEAPGADMALPRQPSFNLHDFRWEHALHAGKRMYGDRFPEDVRVILVEAASVDPGVELTPAGQLGAQEATRRILALVQRRLEPSSGCK